MTYRTVNPYTNELIKEYPFATDRDLERALSDSYSLYKKMKTQDLSERASILHNIAKYFRDHEDELGKICTVDMGKLFIESKGEVELCAIIADYFADHAGEFLKPLNCQIKCNTTLKNIS